MGEADVRAHVLVVDDSFANRALLRKTLSDEYQVIEAADGLEALEALRRDAGIAAVVLDIQMPRLDGFGVLKAMAADARLKDVPVVVDTGFDDGESQIAALEAGAVDVLLKPFDPRVALCRVRNVIARQEAAKKAALAQVLEHRLEQAEIDEKTGVLNKGAFCRKAARMLKAHPEREHVVLQWDVDRFKVFNDVFGVAEGDRFLAKVGSACRKQAGPDALFGHWEADRFAVCMTKDKFKQMRIEESLGNLMTRMHDQFEFVSRLGVYEVDDPSLNVELMCDRALIALKSTKGDYATRVAYYDASMRAALIEEQNVVAEMEGALEQGEFVIYLQPQYNHATGAIHGAEALVRWIHPQRGLIPPDKFIPAFERNGFISRLDECVWEQVCALLRTWLDAGAPVVPVSVNVSRRDIYNPDLCETFEDLMRRHRLPHELLRIEITESAYMENAQQLDVTVRKLRLAGFAVEMDDFGSGFSSLNTLKRMPVDMLKLDMKFLEGEDDDTRGGSILTSVIRMANWIGLPVIAEGVETKEQAEYLKSVGCALMQGYYFAKPLPVKDFEALLAREGAERDSVDSFTGSIEGAEDFLSASTQASLLFNSFVGGAAIVEYDGSNVEALRLNDRYFEVLGTTREEYADKQLRLPDRLDQASRATFLDAVRAAVSSGEESDCELHSLPLREGSPDIWVNVRMRLLARAGIRFILYMAVENISHRVRLAERLQSIMDNVPEGILDFELADRPRVTFFNDTVPTMFGYSREEYGAHMDEHPLSLVHPDDLATVRSKVREVLLGSMQSVEVMYRHLCAQGGWLWVRLRVRVARRQGSLVFASGVLADIDGEVRAKRTAAEQAERIASQQASLRALYGAVPCGIMQFSVDVEMDEVGSLVSFNDATWRILGYESREKYVEEVHGKSKFVNVHPEDLPKLRARIESLLEDAPGAKASLDHRIVKQDGSVRWVRSDLQRVRPAGEGEEVLQAVFTDITEQKQDDMKRLVGVLFGLYDEIFEFDTESDSCIMRSAKNPDDPRVGKITSFSAHLDTLCSRYVCEDEGARVREFYNQALEGAIDAPRMIEYRYNAIDGSGRRWASATLVSAGGSKYLTCNRDVTEEKVVESLSKETESLRERSDGWRRESERYRALLGSMGILICDYDFDSDVLKIQRAKAAGGVVEEVTPRYLETIRQNAAVSLEDRARVGNLLHEMLRAPGRRSFEYRSNRFGDGFCLCLAQVASVVDAEGTARHVVGQIARVSDVRAIEEGDASRRRDDQVDGSIRHALTLFGIFYEVLELDFAKNEFWAVLSRRAYGPREDDCMALDEAIELWLSNLPDAEERAKLIEFTKLESIQAAFRQGIAPSLEYGIIAPDGSRRRCSSTLLQLDASRYLCCNKDVTGRREVDELQREAQELKARAEEQDRFRMIVDQLGIALIDRNYRTGEFFSNEAYESYELSKYDYVDVFSNAADRELVHPDDWLSLDAFFAVGSAGARGSQTDLRLRMTDGSYRWTRMVGVFERDDSGTLSRAIGAFFDIDAELRARAEAELLAERLSRIVSSVPVGIVIYELEPATLPLYVSDRSCEMFGLTRAECELSIANGKSIGFTPDEATLGREGVERLLAGEAVAVARFRPEGRVGQRTWLSAFCNTGKDRAGKTVCYAVIADVTADVERDQERAWREERHRLLNESTDTMTFDYSPFDDVMHVSMTRPDQGFVEEVHEQYLATLDQSGRVPDDEKPAFARALRNACQNATQGSYDFTSDHYSGEPRWYRARFTSLADEDGCVYRVVGRFDDIDDIMTTQNQLRASAQIDEMSGVYNKNHAVAAIAEALRTKEPTSFDAVIFLDIDDFKSVNDTYGHLRADEVLRRVGDILRRLFRQGDIAARFGGDEFIVYLRSANGLAEVEEKAERILEEVRAIEIEGSKPVTCSIGIAGITGAEMDYAAALSLADEALYQAKKAGKNRYVVA